MRARYPRSFDLSRGLVLSFSATALVAAAVQLTRSGTLRTPAIGGLIYDPGARHSDLRDLMAYVASGYPYGIATPEGITTGPSYPPGAFPALAAANLVGVRLAEAAVVISTAVCLALLCALVLNRGESNSVRLGGGAAAAAATLTAAVTLDFYAAVVVLFSALATIAVTAGTRWPVIHAMAVPMIFGVSLPLVFAIDRMNIDVIVMQMVALAAVLTVSHRRSTAAVAIGVAIAAKAYPIWFLIADTYAPRRRVRFGVACVTAGAITAWGFLITHYSIREAIDGFNRAVDYFELAYVLQESGMPYGASLLTSLRILYTETGRADHAAFIVGIYPEWKALAPIAVGLVALIVITLGAPSWCRLLTVICALMVFSPNTGIYRAAVLVVPLALWLLETRLRSTTHQATRLEFALACFAGVGLAPLSFWTVTGFEQVRLTSQTILSPAVFSIVLVLGLMIALQRRGLMFKASRIGARAR